jgi:hypothetical protein
MWLYLWMVCLEERLTVMCFSTWNISLCIHLPHYMKTQLLGKCHKRRFFIERNLINFPKSCFTWESFQQSRSAAVHSSVLWELTAENSSTFNNYEWILWGNWRCHWGWIQIQQGAFVIWGRYTWQAHKFDSHFLNRQNNNNHKISGRKAKMK